MHLADRRPSQDRSSVRDRLGPTVLSAHVRGPLVVPHGDKGRMPSIPNMRFILHLLKGWLPKQ